VIDSSVLLVVEESRLFLGPSTDACSWQVMFDVFMVTVLMCSGTFVGLYRRLRIVL
jgi:hypothetical protein